MGTVRQWVGRITPCTTAVRRCRAEHLCAVEYIHRAVGLCGAGQHHLICIDNRVARMTGVLGAFVSIVTLSAVEAPLALPAASVAVARESYGHHSPAQPSCKLHAPLPLATALPSSVAPSNTLTVELASAAPVRVSVLSLVMSSPFVPLSVENEAMVGAAGATVSSVTFMTADAALVVPDTVVGRGELMEPVRQG